MKNDNSKMPSSKELAQAGLDNLNDTINKLREAYNNTGQQGFLDLIEKCENDKKIFEEVLKNGIFPK